MISTLFDLRAVKTAILCSWLFSTIYSTRQSSRSYKFIIQTAFPIATFPELLKFYSESKHSPQIRIDRCGFALFTRE